MKLGPATEGAVKGRHDRSGNPTNASIREKRKIPKNKRQAKNIKILQVVKQLD